MEKEREFWKSKQKNLKKWGKESFYENTRVLKIKTKKGRKLKKEKRNKWNKS